MTPEGRVKNQLNTRLKPLVDQRKVHKLMPVQTGFGIPGLDYHLCVAGWYVAIETKKDAKGKLTPRQLETKAHIEEAGGYVFVVYDHQTVNMVMEFIVTLCNVSDAHRAVQKEFTPRPKL